MFVGGVKQKSRSSKNGIGWLKDVSRINVSHIFLFSYANRVDYVTKKRSDGDNPPDRLNRPSDVYQMMTRSSSGMNIAPSVILKAS